MQQEQSVHVHKGEVTGKNLSLQEVRHQLLEYVQKSNVLSDAELHILRDGVLKCSDMFDLATHLECHATKVAINDVIRCNVVKAVDVIASIDDGWDGNCITCEIQIPTKRILMAYSQQCVDCKRKSERHARGER